MSTPGWGAGLCSRQRGGAAEQGSLHLLQHETSLLLAPHAAAVGIWGALRVEGEQGWWEMPLRRGQDSGTSLWQQEEAVVGASWSRGCPAPIPAPPRPQTSHPSIHPSSPTACSLTWDRLCFLTPCSVPHGDGAVSLGGCWGSSASVGSRRRSERVPSHGGGGSVPALPWPRVWLGKARHVPSVVELALQVVGIETMKGCNTSLGFFFFPPFF